MIQHRARNTQKWGARKGALDDAARKALQSTIVNDLVEIDSDEPLEAIITPFSVPNLTADVYNVSSIMQADIYEISGVNEYLRGASPEIRRTATEATIIEGASNVKSQYKLRQIEKAARKVGQLLLGFAADVYPQTDYDEMQLFLTGRDAELIFNSSNEEERTDEAGAMIEPGQVRSATITPSPDVWVGTYEVFVEQASTELRNPIMREQKYRGIVMDLSGLIPVLAEQGVQLNLKKLISLWLEAAGIEDVDGLFGPTPAPQLDPGRIDIQGESEISPEALAGLLGVDFAGEAAAPAAGPGVPPDLSLGAFGPENTGALEPIEG
jgi:hypothetical protein